MAKTLGPLHFFHSSVCAQALESPMGFYLEEPSSEIKGLTQKLSGVLEGLNHG